MDHKILNPSTLNLDIGVVLPTLGTSNITIKDLNIEQKISYKYLFHLLHVRSNLAKP
jgi:hypothetical protein